PQLQQAIKLLQMSRMELVEMVREEMLENPVLEDGASDENEPTETGANSNGEADGSPSAPPPAPLEHEPPEPAPDKKEDSIDWERYLENHALQAPLPSFRGGSDREDLPGLEATLTRSEDIVDHLSWQIRMSDLVEDEQRFAALVIGNIDDDGYLKLEDVPENEVVPKLAREAELDAEDAEEVLKIIQRFDPPGVAARSLRECLRIQAEHFRMDQLVMSVIENHLTNLEKRNYPAIAKDLSIELEDVYDIAQVIAELDPKPGRNYSAQETQYITPDVYVHKVGDKYFVVPNDDGMPRLKISGFYRSAMADNPQAKEYIQNKLRSAQWLIRSIDQRRKTIVRVTECIVDKQRDFFDKGIEHLKPMILRDVAETVGMHESTISRVTSNKYVHTPRGIFELKYFFNSAIRRDNDDDIASESVKQAIKKII
ncbi:MAG: RNA polymerase factor sigma-54, partial [Myxococcales bacterium]|nr:RNA polymerase factor sigma-54 [Myxococcales bacterium]